MEASRESTYKQTFAKLGWVLIASQVLMMAVVWAGEELHIRWLIARDPMIGAVELMHKLQDSGVWLIVGALAGLTPCLALKLTEHPKQLPAFFGKKNQRIGGTIMVFCFLLVMGLQNIASLLTIPVEVTANLLGGSFYSAHASATAASQTASMLLYSVLIAPFCEELMYRGFVLEYLKPYGNTFAILFAAVIFGLMHGNIIQLPMALLCGVLFGYIAVEYSLSASMVLHALTNLTAEILARLGDADEVAAAGVNQALFAFGLIALFLCITKLHQPIRAYARQGYAEKKTVKLLMTSPPILLLIIYLIILTAMSITPI